MLVAEDVHAFAAQRVTVVDRPEPKRQTRVLHS